MTIQCESTPWAVCYNPQTRRFTVFRLVRFPGTKEPVRLEAPACFEDSDSAARHAENRNYSERAEEAEVAA